MRSSDVLSEGPGVHRTGTEVDPEELRAHVATLMPSARSESDISFFLIVMRRWSEATRVQHRSRRHDDCVAV
jgi:hypothetical protein